MKTKIYFLLLFMLTSKLLGQEVSLLKDINLGSSHAIPEYLTEINGKLYFSAFDEDHGNELWISDGTAPGTTLLKDIKVTEFDFQDSNSNPRYLTALNNKLYFIANDGNGTALWESDGTTAGTKSIIKKDENEVTISFFRYLIAYNGKLYFQANNGSGIELFVSDGTEAGTKMLKDINSNDSEGSQPKDFIVYNGKLYFTASDRTNGLELWVTDGTSENTKIVKDINLGSFGSNPTYFEVFNGKLYFSAYDGNGSTNFGRELWVTEGTEATTVMVKNISTGNGSSNPSYLKTLNDKMYFVANADTNDAELWETDGTSDGTKLFKNLNGNSLSSGIRHLTSYNNKLYFQANVSFNIGRELWETDGTTDGTKLTQDINERNASSNPSNFTVVNDRFYFTANDGRKGIEVYFLFNGPRTHVPDNNFEQALIDLGYDDILDNYVITDNIKDVTNLELQNKEIEDLTGIEGFTNLTNLNVSNNLLTELDISKNEKLYNLVAFNNNIASFEVTNNFRLYSFSLKNNGLRELKLIGISDLAEIDVSENNLTALNLNAARSLIGITANDNDLSILKINNGNANTIQIFKVNNNSNLTCVEIDDLEHANTILSTNSTMVNKDEQTSFSLDCNYSNDIFIADSNFEQALIDMRLDDVVDQSVLKSNIENIQVLMLNDRSISNLTGIQGFTSLIELNVNNNNLVSLNTNQNLNLKILKATNNNLSELITTNSSLLQEVDVSNNNFTTFSLPSNNNLQKLNCSENINLTNLNLQNNINLKELIVNNTSLTTLDVSSNSILISLTLQKSNLSVLDLSSKRDLQYLNISNNSISELNLTDTFSLTNFIASNNSLTSLNLSSAINLVQFSASNNNLTAVDLRNGNSSNIEVYNTTNNLSLSCVEVDDVIFANQNFVAKDAQTTFYLDCNFSGQIYIPDTNFEQELINLGIDDNLNSYLPKNDAASVTELILDRKNISDLTGIEGFVNLQKLSVFDNNLSHLDVRRNVELLELNCSTNNLEELDVALNIKLTDLKCESNMLSDINLKPLINLVSTTVASNRLENLDISENLMLEFFKAENNNLSCIKVKDVAFAETNWSNNVDNNVVFSTDCEVVEITDPNLEATLIELGLDNFLDGYASLNQIRNTTVLDVSNKNISDLSIIKEFTNLERLICNNNNLTKLDVSNNTNLIEIQASYNQISTLFLGSITSLEILDCSHNRIITLDVTQNNNLKKLNCEVNLLTEINTSNNASLQDLNCSNNDIISIDLNSNTALEYLTILHMNVLNSVNISNNTLLKQVWAYNNNALPNIDVSTNINLERLIVSGCSQINTIDVANNTVLKFLSLGESNFLNLDLSTNTALETLWIYESDIRALDLKENTLLKELDVSNTINLSNLDLSNNIGLEKLEANDSNLNTIDLSNNTSLNYINTRNNEDLFCIKVSDENFPNQIDRRLLDNQTDFNTDCSTIWTINVDPTLQTALDAIPNLDTNNDGKITLLEAANFQGGLDLANKGLTNIEGLQAFTSITILDISGNNITDLSPLTDLNIEVINRNGNKKTSKKTNTTMALEFLYANNNQIETANLDSLTNLIEIDISNNPELITLSIKNGNNNQISFFDSKNTPKLSCILVDDKEANILSTWNTDTANKFVENEAQCRAEVLSVEEFSKDDVRLFPNPVSNILTIQSSKEFNFIEIYNTLGKQILKSKTKKVDFSSYASGIYLIKIITDNASITKRIIKN